MTKVGESLAPSAEGKGAEAMSWYYGRRRSGYWPSVGRLMGHLLGTGVIFCAILLLSWGLSWVIHTLNAAHPLPPDIYSFLTRIELWLVYLDVGVSLFVFLTGTGRFLIEIWEDRR